MKLNDPFGRMASRDKTGYESTRNTMRKSGIDTISLALEVVTQSKKCARNYIVIGVTLLLLVTLIVPKSFPVTISFGIFFVVWVITSTRNGQRYIQRYIDEDLKVDSSKDN